MFYLAIGHACFDFTPAGYQVGGTVSYALAAAAALGWSTGVITSVGPSFPLAETFPHSHIYNRPAPVTTSFTNQQTERGRHQILHHRAHLLEPDDLPPDWPPPTVVHLAPIAAEVNPAMLPRFTGPQRPFIGLTPQGWMRSWDETGQVRATAWDAAATVLPLADAVVVSQEDWPDEAAFALFRRQARLLVVTAGAQGCYLYQGEAQWHVPVAPVAEVDSTGAGDLFAAAFFIHLKQTNDPAAAAQFANQVAAQSVTQSHLTGKIEVIRHHLQTNTAL